MAQPERQPATAPGHASSAGADLPFLRLPAFVWLGLLLVVFMVRILPWLVADLWYDEVITLLDFAIGPPRPHSVWLVFRTYPVANNHILFSAILWVWVRLLDLRVTEWLLRLPSVFFALLTLGWIVRCWRRWLGTRAAWIAGLAFAVSPVYAAFAYQMRGYTLSMFLGAVAVTALLDLRCGARPRRALGLYAVTAALLPLVMPMNVLLVAGHLLFLLLEPVGTSSRWRRALAWWPIAAGAAMGCGYYLTIWPQFMRTAQETTGWSSAWRVAGHWVLAFLAHLGPLVVVALVGLRRRYRQPAFRPLSAPTASPATAGSKPAPIPAAAAVRLLLCSLAPILAVLLVLRSPPFPRTFLVFLPTFTLAALLLTAAVPVWTARGTLFLAGAVFANALAWEKATSALTRRQVLAGLSPQNLVQQYYRGSTSLSEIVRRLRLEPDLDLSRTAVLTDFFDFPTFRYYWTSVAGWPPEQVLAENRDPGRVWAEDFGAASWQLGIVARNAAEARRLLACSGAVGQPVLRFAVTDRGFFLVQSDAGAGASPSPGPTPPRPAAD